MKLKPVLSLAFAAFIVLGLAMMPTQAISSGSDGKSVSDDKNKSDSKDKDKNESKDKNKSDGDSDDVPAVSQCTYPAGVVCVCNPACVSNATAAAPADDSSGKDKNKSDDESKDKSKSGDDGKSGSSDNGKDSGGDKNKDKNKSDDKSKDKNKSDNDSDDAAAASSQGVACTCMDGSSGMLYDSAGPATAPTAADPNASLLTPVTNAAAGGNGAGSGLGGSYREISGQ